MRAQPLCVIAAFVCAGAAAASDRPLVVDHTCTSLDTTPAASIQAAAATLHVAYNHTSHGSHLVTGMEALAAFPDFGNLFRWSVDGSTGLQLADHGIPCDVPDLSQGDFIDANGVTPWVTCTRAFLDAPANDHFNVVMWSWCSINAHDAQRYVDNMEILVSEYPDVVFVFMTGHAQGQGEDMTPGRVHFNNELIRQHCRDHGRVLFDFADIEAFDPDGEYFWDRGLMDNLDYDGGNWAREWISENPGSELARLTMGDSSAGYNGCGNCLHSSWPREAKLNCVLKGRAAWWMFAELAAPPLEPPAPRMATGRVVPEP